MFIDIYVGFHLEAIVNKVSGTFYICFLIFVIILLLHWGYIVTFTKVLTIYHSWIYPLYHSPLSPLSHFWNSFNRSHFFIFINEYIISPPYSPSYTLSLYLLPPTGTNAQTRPVLPSCSLYLKTRHFCLFREFHCGISMVKHPFLAAMDSGVEELVYSTYICFLL
jgi:hypothetical protein